MSYCKCSSPVVHLSKYVLLTSPSNTAQVLTSGAEAISGGRRSSEESRQNALQMLQEALELFQRCLTVQELQFTESQERMEMTDDTSSSPGIGDDEDTSGIRDGSEGIVDDRWASVVEPVTKDSLVDTAVAQLETLTTACGLLTSDAGSGLAWIEEYSNNLLQGKIATYVAGTNRHHEVSLARANFICALADTCYRTGRIDLQTYEKEIASAFGPYLDLSQDPQGLCDKADALIAFISAIYESISASTEQNPHQLTLLNALLWNHLTMASTSLSSAAKLPTTHKLAKIHIARGDVELFRFRLGEAPLFHAVAKKHAKTLLKNAEVYFRGAAGIAKSEGSVDEEREATIKLAIAGTIVGDHSNILTLLAKENKEILAVVEDMVEDGIVGKEWLERFGGG